MANLFSDGERLEVRVMDQIFDDNVHVPIVEALHEFHDLQAGLTEWHDMFRANSGVLE